MYLLMCCKLLFLTLKKKKYSVCCVSHPGLHRGLFHYVLQSLLMVPGWLRTRALFLHLFLHQTDTVHHKYIRLSTHTHSDLIGYRQPCV